MKRQLFIALGMIVFVLTGCNGEPEQINENKQNTGNWIINQTVSPSKLPTDVIQMIDKECDRFGEGHPKILIAVTDVDDPDQKPMYNINVKGHFVFHGKKTDELGMLILKDGSFGSVDSPPAFVMGFTMTKIQLPQKISNKP